MTSRIHSMLKHVWNLDTYYTLMMIITPLLLLMQYMSITYKILVVMKMKSTSLENGYERGGTYLYNT
jgi:hypothetical protein